MHTQPTVTITIVHVLSSVRAEKHYCIYFFLVLNQSWTQVVKRYSLATD